MKERPADSNGQDDANGKAENLAEKARQWVASPQGQRAINTSLENVMKMTAQLKEERRLNPDDLHQPLDSR